jgi:hypothetical protein
MDNNHEIKKVVYIDDFEERGMSPKMSHIIKAMRNPRNYTLKSPKRKDSNCHEIKHKIKILHNNT